LWQIVQQKTLTAMTKNPNPIKDLLYELQTNTKVITLEYLVKLGRLFKKYGVQFNDYGAVFEMLKFLEQNGCVTITEQSDGSYLITGLYNYGQNLQ
jgi:hypothetical protein